MTRVKRGNTKQRRHKKLLNKAKGFYGRAKSIFKQAKPFVQRSLMYATRDRLARKRDFKSVWVVRINAALQERGLSYSSFMGAYKAGELKLNRKMLSQLAVLDTAAFDAVVAATPVTAKVPKAS